MVIDPKGIHVKRRDFIKTTTLVSIAAAALPQTSLIGQDARSALRPIPRGRKRTVLFLNDNPSSFEKFIASIKAIKEFDISVIPIQINFQKPQDILNSIQGKDADLLFICLPRVTNNSGIVPTGLADFNVPIILLPVNFDLIMLEADVAASFRMRGANAMLANSEAHALELIKTASTSRILEGKKIVIYGRPFDSSSIPARHLNAEYVYQHTGVRIEYRPIDELKPLLATVDEAKAVKEMERWKKEAFKVVEASDKALLESCRLYVLLRSIADKESLAGISIDCLNFSFNANPILPYPCLPFTRLRDDGIAAPCEADVCASLSSMLFQEISKRSSYLCNVSGVNETKSSIVLRHCVAPLKLMGQDAPPLRYTIRDYHGTGRGATPEVEFPIGVDVTMGAFSKDLKSIVLWPGKTIARVKDTDTPSFANLPATATPEMRNMRKFCSNHLEVQIKDMDRFLQNISGCHYVMIAGTYTKAFHEEMLRMNVSIISPSDSAAPA
jgi:L-fucose isomerase-like protein